MSRKEIGVFFKYQYALGKTVERTLDIRDQEQQRLQNSPIPPDYIDDVENAVSGTIEYSLLRRVGFYAINHRALVPPGNEDGGEINTNIDQSMRLELSDYLMSVVPNQADSRHFDRFWQDLYAIHPDAGEAAAYLQSYLIKVDKLLDRSMPDMMAQAGRAIPSLKEMVQSGRDFQDYVQALWSYNIELAHIAMNWYKAFIQLPLSEQEQLLNLR